jgi:hypothetical protein
VDAHSLARRGRVAGLDCLEHGFVAQERGHRVLRVVDDAGALLTCNDVTPETARLCASPTPSTWIRCGCCSGCQIEQLRAGRTLEPRRFASDGYIVER